MKFLSGSLTLCSSSSLVPVRLAWSTTPSPHSQHSPAPSLEPSFPPSLFSGQAWLMSWVLLGLPPTSLDSYLHVNKTDTSSHGNSQTLGKLVGEVLRRGLGEFSSFPFLFISFSFKYFHSRHSARHWIKDDVYLPIIPFGESFILTPHKAALIK